MLLLLPPSEAKTSGGAGPSFDALSTANTGPQDPLLVARRKVLSAVVAFCRRTPRKARLALKLPAGSAAHDLAANIAMLEAPTMPALDRFTGVLFAALDIGSMTLAQRRRADQSILVFSGAFGALRGDDPVPLHRVPASATVPRVGGLATYWRKVLGPVLLASVDAEELVVDLRSSDYAAMWQPAPEQAARVVAVRVLEDRGGVLRPVSWSAKHGKGRLARELLRSDPARLPVRTREDVAAAAVRIGYQPRITASGLDLVAPP